MTDIDDWDIIRPHWEALEHLTDAFYLVFREEKGGWYTAANALASNGA